MAWKPTLQWVLSQPRSGHRRASIGAPCRFAQGDRSHEGTVWNVSTLGAYVAMASPLPSVGEVLHLSFEVTGDPSPVTCAVRVAWQNPPSIILKGLGSTAYGLPPGCGLQFLTLSAAARSRIEAHVRLSPDRAPTAGSRP